jgi:hypothetical protein
MLFLALLSLPPGPIVRLVVAESASGSRSHSIDDHGGICPRTNDRILFINSHLITDDSEGEREGVKGCCCRSTRIAVVDILPKHEK